MELRLTVMTRIENCQPCAFTENKMLDWEERI